jgi:hypothetical protein
MGSSSLGPVRRKGWAWRLRRASSWLGFFASVALGVVGLLSSPAGASTQRVEVESASCTGGGAPAVYEGRTYRQMTSNITCAVVVGAGATATLALDNWGSAGQTVGTRIGTGAWADVAANGSSTGFAVSAPMHNLTAGSYSVEIRSSATGTVVDALVVEVTEPPPTTTTTAAPTTTTAQPPTTTTAPPATTTTSTPTTTTTTPPPAAGTMTLEASQYESLRFGLGLLVFLAASAWVSTIGRA